MGNHKPRQPFWRLFRWLVFLGIVVGIGMRINAVLSLPLPETYDPGAFSFDAAFDLEKVAPGGTKYTVNNSIATFDLDVADDDRHCRTLFRSYAAALAYCRDAGLPTLPSVHLVQGKCKQFDDGLTAALELAIQRGLPGDSHLGRQDALERLLATLLELPDQSPATDRDAADRAAVYVATALKLAGVELQVPARLAKRIAATEAKFLEMPEARPIGFWNWSHDLRAIFLQDRFLSLGMPADSPEAIVVAMVILRDPLLVEAFRRFHAFDAKLTNPPERGTSEQSATFQATVLFIDMAEFVGSPSHVLSSKEFHHIGSLLSERFGKNARFALATQAASKEYDLLAPLGAQGDVTDSMGLIIDAVKTGRLDLEPKDDSGWYDYQWYALETLLLPNKAQEAGKLTLSASYKRRLEDAFRTSLTKHRETHIKRLPYITLCSSLGGEPREPEKIEIGPQFCAEPTATVYLRYARGYRFLRTAMHAVLGQSSLQTLHRSNEGDPAVHVDLDTELRDLSLLCYGLYDRLCLEIGQHPEYLPDEMDEAAVEDANAMLQRWLDTLADDPDLARDTRVAVPIAVEPGVRAHYWATGGVRLQRVAYEYDFKPYVAGNVEVTYAPAYYYLPTDIFLEFERPSSEPLTRSEYRVLCDRCQDEDALRTALGSSAWHVRFRWQIFFGCFALLLISAAMLWCYRNRLRELKQVTQKRWTKSLWRGTKLAGAVCLGLWIIGVMSFKEYRTKLIVRYVTCIDIVAVLLDSRFSDDHSRDNIAALVDLHADDDPQTRYLASRYLQQSWPPNEKAALVLKEIPSVKTRLQEAARDPVSEVAANSILLLGYFKDRQNVDFLLNLLRSERHIDAHCMATVTSLAKIGDPQALDSVIQLIDDPRASIRRHVAWSLAGYDDQRAVAKLSDLLQSLCYRTRHGAIEGIGRSRRKFDPGWKSDYNAALLAAARETHIPWNDRCYMADNITDPDLAAEAYAFLLNDVPSPDTKPHVLAGLVLGRMGHCGDRACHASWSLVNKLEHEEDLCLAIEAAVDADNHEALVQLTQDAIGDDLDRLQKEE